jgi:DnaJ-class molecular chaperone
MSRCPKCGGVGSTLSNFSKGARFRCDECKGRGEVDYDALQRGRRDDTIQTDGSTTIRDSDLPRTSSSFNPFRGLFDWRR